MADTSPNVIGQQAAPTPSEDTLPPASVPERAAAGERLRRTLARAWAVRGLWLGAGAFLLSLYATLLLASPDARNWAELLLVVSAVLAVMAWGRQRSIRALSPRVASLSLLKWSWERSLRFAGILLSMLLIWQASAVYNTHPEEAFGGAGWLWLGSMALLVASTVAWPATSEGRWIASAWRKLPWSRRHPSQAGPTAATAEAAAPTSLPVRAARRSAAAIAQPVAEAWVPWEVCVFAGIVLMAFVLRLWDLRDYPFAVHGDEILTGRTAVSNYILRDNATIFGTYWDNINLPGLWFVIVAVFLKLGNSTIEALRMPAALFGAATVIPFYGLVRGAWGRWAAILGSAVLAFSAGNLHYSRITTNNIVTPFFWAVCFFFVLRGLRLKRPVDFVLAGIAGGLSEYFYYGTRLLWLLLIVFALYMLVAHWREGWRYLGHFALVALGYLAAFGPLFAYFLKNPTLYFGRGSAQGVLMWDHIPTSWDDLVRMWNTLWPLFADNLLGMSTQSSQDSFYWAPLLLPAEAALLLLGVALLIWRWRHPPAFLMLLSGFGVLFVGGTLVHGTPFIVHWTPAFPAIFAAIAVPAGAWAASAWGILRERWRHLVPALLAAGVVLLGWINIDFFFNRYYAYRPEFEIRSAQVRFEAALGTGYRVRNVGRTWQPYDPEFNSYFIKGQDGAQIYNPSAELPLTGTVGQGLSFVFFPDNEQYRSVVESLYPGGKEDDVRNHDGQTHLFYTYTVPPQLAESANGLRLQVFGQGGQLNWSGTVHRVGALPPEVTYPARALWSGAVYIPMSDNFAHTYRFDVQGAQGKVTFDGQPGPPGPDGLLQPGWHHIEVEVPLDAPANARLMWGVDGGALTEVPAAYLWPAAPNQGLLGAIADNYKGVALRTDPFIGFTAASATTQGILGPALGATTPVRGRWSGQLGVEQAGQYVLEVRTDGQTRLSIDGRPAAVACSGGDIISGSASLTLSAGWHDVQLDYVGAPGPNYLELYWTPPGGPRQIVPPTALHFASPVASDQGSGVRVSPPTPPNALDCSPIPNP